MRLKLPLFICLVSLVGSAFAAAPADSGDARLRDTLRSTLQQLNTAEADRAALQSAQAESDRQVKELTAQLAAAVKRSAADKVAAEKALDAVAVRLAMREHEIERLQRAQAEAKAANEKTAVTVREEEQKNAALAAKNLVLQRRLDDLRAKNAALFKLGNEILVRYENYGLGKALLAKEPFVGQVRVKLENQVQDYADKLADQKLNP